MTQTVDIPAREPLSGTMCRAARPGLKLQLEAFRCGPAFPSHSLSPGATSRWSNRGKAASCSRLAPSVRDGIAVPLSKVHTAPGYDSACADMNSGQAGTSGARHRALHASGGCTAVTRRTRARGLAHARWGVRSYTESAMASLRMEDRHRVTRQGRAWKTLTIGRGAGNPSG